MGFQELLESFAYAIARGCVRAYLDVLQDRATAIVEKPNADAQTAASRFAAAVARVQLSATAADNPGPVGTPPPGG